MPENAVNKNHVIARVTIIGGGAPGANTDIFTAFQPDPHCGKLAVAVSLATASVLNLIVRTGVTVVTTKLNDGEPVPAGKLYEFFVGVRSKTDAGVAITYALQVATDGAIDYLLVDELHGSVA